MKVNWDMVKTAALGLFAAGSPLATFLIAFGVPQANVNAWMVIGASVVALIAMVAPNIALMLRQSDQGKADMIEHLSPAAKSAVFDKLPPATKIAAVTALPEIEKIVVAPGANGAAAAAAADPAQPKVVPHEDAKP